LRVVYGATEGVPECCGGVLKHEREGKGLQYGGREWIYEEERVIVAR